jgi:mono/diheme cytochrome c family protein
VLLGLAGCDRPEPPAHLRIAGGDVDRGRRLIERYECGSCHDIDGIRGADGVVGPPLTRYAQRVLLAGIVPNAPRTLVPWLMDPAALDPDTAMPNLGITDPEARDIATYLYTLGAGDVRVWPPEVAAAQGLGEQPPATRAGGPQPPGSLPIERAMEALIEGGGSVQSPSP